MPQPSGRNLTRASLAQDDKYTANYMLPYCRAAVNNEAPKLTIDAVLQGMCVGVVDAIEFTMNEYSPDEKDLAVCLPNDVTLSKPCKV
jgi:hypothetical protein